MHRIISGLISLLAAVALGFASPPLRAEKKPASPAAPPQPVQLNIKVKREARTEIPLQIYGRRNESLKYLIRSEPEHGKITEPRQTQKESAVVIYDPPEDLSVTHDKFLFAVQSSEGVSAAVEVSITIVDAPPILAIPKPVEFPKILAGTTSVKVLELANHGGGSAAGEMIVDGPWRIEGSRAYRIPAGETAAFKLIFEPKAGGVFEGSISFTSDREHSTLIQGEAIAPLSVQPEKIAMESAWGDAVRTGSFEIHNETDQARSLKINGGARLQAPDKVSVPPHDKITVPIQTLPTDVASINEEITVQSEGFSQRIAVKAPALNAMVRFNSKVLDIGKRPAGKPAVADVEIENVGGLPGAVSLSVAAPFTVEPSTAVLQPGAKKTAQIKLPASGPGKYRAWLKLTTGGQESEIGVQAEFLAARGQSPSNEASGATAQETSSEALKAEPIESPEKEPHPSKSAIRMDWGASFVPGDAVKVIETTPYGATLAWKDTLSPASHFRVELRHMGLDASHSLAVSWIEHKPVTIRHENGQYLVTLRELQPQQVWAVRVLPLNDAGDAGERLFALTFSTPVAPSSASQVSLIQWLFLALAACLAVVIWRYLRKPGNTEFM